VFHTCVEKVFYTCVDDVLIHVLMMYDDMQNVVNVYIMHVFVNGLLYGLECEHMSIVNCC